MRTAFTPMPVAMCLACSGVKVDITHGLVLNWAPLPPLPPPVPAGVRVRPSRLRQLVPLVVKEKNMKLGRNTQ